MLTPRRLHQGEPSPWLPDTSHGCWLKRCCPRAPTNTHPPTGASPCLGGRCEARHVPGMAAAQHAWRQRGERGRAAFGDQLRDPSVSGPQPRSSPKHRLERGRGEKPGGCRVPAGTEGTRPHPCCQGLRLHQRLCCGGLVPRASRGLAPSHPPLHFYDGKEKKTQMSLVCFGGSPHGQPGASSCEKGKKLH